MMGVNSKANSLLRRVGLTAVKFALGTGLLVLLLARRDIAWDDLTASAVRLLTQPLWLAATILPVGACLFCGAARWHAALIGLGVPISRGRTGAVFMIGHFFNGFLPGTTGGDVLRALYISREAPDRRPEAMVSIVVERFAGIVALFILTLAGLALSPASRHRWPALVAVATALATVTLALYFALPDPRRFRNLPLLSRLAAHPRLGPLTWRLYEALRLGRRSPALSLRLLAWSFLQHACAILSWLACASALGVACDPVAFVLLIPVLLTVQMLPFTPGGLGIREGAAVMLLPAAGVAPPAAMAVALTAYAATLAWSAAGGLVFVAFRGRRG